MLIKNSLLVTTPIASLMIVKRVLSSGFLNISSSYWWSL